MQGHQFGRTKVSVSGRTEDVQDRSDLAALCAAVEHAVHEHRPAGLRVREVIVMLDEGATAYPTDAMPVYVDVYDSGYGHGI